MTAPAIFDPAHMGTREFHLDPYPYWRYLRDEHPVYNHPLGGMWLVSRYEDVIAGFKDHDRLSSRIMEQSHDKVFGRSLTSMDGDEHTNKRNIIAPEFVGKKIEAFLPVIESNARMLITKFAEKSARDLIEGFQGDGEVDQS